MDTILSNLNFSSSERAVIVLLLDAKKSMKSREIAKSLNFPRQTAYSILLACVKKGVVIQTDKNGIKHFYCDIRELVKYIDLQKDILSKAQHQLRGEKSYLPKDTEKSFLPKVHFYEGTSGLLRLFKSILDEYKKGKSKKFRGYGINYFSHSKTLENYLGYFVKQRAHYGVETDLFIAKGPDGFNIKDNASALKRKIKRLNIEPQMAGIYFVADRVYLFSYKDNAGIMIENKSILNMLKDVFDDHWERVG